MAKEHQQTQPVMHPATIMRLLASMLPLATAMRPQPQSLDRRALLQTLALAPLPAQASTFADAPLVPRSLVVNCVDVPATAAFYSEALGMTVVAEKGGAATQTKTTDATGRRGSSTAASARGGSKHSARNSKQVCVCAHRFHG